MSDVTPIKSTNPGQEIQDLFAQKGELITQVEIAQAKLSMINQKLSAILNIGQSQSPTSVR